MFNTSANIPDSEIKMRIQRLQHEMAATGLDGILLMQSTDLYYFCGTAQQAHLYIPVEGDPILMVKKSISRARSESPLKTITVLESPARLPDLLKAHNYPAPRFLGMELDILPVNLYNRYPGLWRGVTVQDCSPMIRELRAIKSPFEIDLIQQAAGLADHTRIYCLGELPDQLMDAHMAMLELQTLVSREARPGTRAGDLYDLALDFVKIKGYENFFMGGDEQRVSFIGHGIGLELDEFPFLAAGQKMKLREGMIIALEPKLIFPEQGVVGIENTHLVTADGLERLTRFEDGIITL